jgi:predicted MPP superfamily phosphohydrolase
MPDFIERLASAAFWAAGGFCAFLLLYMRVLSRLPSGPLKRAAAVAGLGGAPALFALAGAWTGLSAGLAVPAAFLLSWLALDALALRDRRRHRAGGPVEVRRDRRRLSPFCTFDLQIPRYEIPSPVPVPRRFRIVHLSDLHLNDRSSERWCRRLVEDVEGLAPDLLVATGDFSFSQTDSRRLEELLAAFRARAGAFAVLGNHDYSVGPDAIAAQLVRAGWRLPGADAVAAELPGGRRLWVAGYDFPWSREARRPVAPADGEPLIVLTHTADNASRLAEGGAFAVFAGHYHGGQIGLPGWGPIALPSRLGRRFPRGHFLFGKTHLFVSAGLGVTFPPFRVGCPPDLPVVDLV